MSKKHEENKQNEDSEKQNLELKNLENQLKRALADYQNLEKRIAAERQEWIKIANKDLLLKLLPGLDSLLLAEKHTQDEGVKISIKHFLETFEQVGVKRIETIGLSFNPEFMEAVATIKGEEGKVVEEVRTGYTLFDIILRPSQVVVGSNE
jgi:molecular chaperone GrpE